MADTARKDSNSVATLLGTSSTDGTPVVIYGDPVTHRLLVDATGTGGSGITSINADTTAAQILAAGTGITITDNGTGTHTITATGTGGTPGGLNTQIQYNNAGSFGGITGATTDGTLVSLNGAHLLNPTINGAGAGLATLTYPNTATSVSIAFPATAGTVALTSQLTSGTVTSVTSADANATVATTTTTPVITIVSAPKWATARNLAGNSVDGSANVAFANKFIVQGTTDAGLSGAQFLGALGTGIVKNTTTTGVLSIAVAADFPTLNQNTTGSAATLTTPRAINGVNFDGSAAITVTAAAGTLTGTTLNSTVVTSSLTTLGSSASLPGSPTTTTQSPADNSTKVATTAYVDNAILGQNFKEAALVATTANLVGVYVSGVFTYTATGTDNIDGVNLALGNRVLVKNQTTTFQNGIYVVTTAGAIGVAGVLTRSSDANTSGEFKTGDALFVTSGTVNASTTWAYTGIDSPNLGTDAITYVQIAGLGSYVAGNGLTLTGNSFSINTSITVDETTSQTLTNKTLTSPILTTPVINGTSTGTGVATAATASTLVLRDANANISANNFLSGFTTTATAAGTTVLTITSTETQVFTGSTTQTVTLPTTSVVAGGSYTIINKSTGAVTVQSSGANAITILAANTSGVFTALVATPTTAANWNSQYFADIVTSGKSLSVTNTLTLSGTDTTTMTFPTTSATIARTDAAQTFTGVQTLSSSPVLSSGAVTVSGTTQTFPTTATTLAGLAIAETFTATQTASLWNTTPQALSVTTNAATADINHGIQNFTNSSAAGMTITLATTSATDGQLKEIRIYDFSAAAQAITFVNTENSTVTVPTTSNGSTTLPLSVLFQFNGPTSKWRCLASS